MTPSDLLSPPKTFGKRMASGEGGAPPPESSSGAPSSASSSASAPTPEAVLRAVFLQALTGKAVAMPPVATAETLRQALLLDPAICTLIFEQARRDVAAAASSSPGPATPVAAPVSKAPAGRPALRPAQRRLIGLAAVAVLAIAGAAGFMLTHRPVPTPKLLATAATNQAAYETLLGRAKTGEPAAEFAIGALLDRRFMPNETVVAKNDAQAFDWYSQAAAGGFAPAAQSVAYAYLNAHGAARDPQAALHWASLAAAAGLPAAQNMLGFMFQNGIGTLADPLRANAWFAKAAAQDFAPAENNLGNAFESGSGVTQDYGQAAALFARAARQGEPNAQNSLGYLFYNGLGVPRDYAKSAVLFHAAAVAGNPAAQVNLGLSFAAGAGVPKDPVRAAAWCLKGQQAGAKTASAALALITPQLTPQQLAAAKSAAAE